MKLQGFLKGVGKIENIVVSQMGGVSIARAYQPNVKNPSTLPQVNQRARLKLASQLAAALAPVIAMAKQGLVSGRNQFIAKNMPWISADSGVAQVSYENLQLTNGTIGLPAISVSRAANKLSVKLAATAETSVSQVVYICYHKNSENALQLIGSKIQTIAGEDGLFQAEFDDPTGDVVIFAYGMNALSGAASAKYGSYQVQNATDIASLVGTRKLSAGDFQFTKTRGATIFAGEEQNSHPTSNQAMIYITAGVGGSVSCDKFTGNRGAVDKGTEVTVTATPNTNYTFSGWFINGTETRVSNSPSYKFTANEQTDLIARFNSNTPSGGGGLEG